MSGRAYQKGPLYPGRKGPLINSRKTIVGRAPRRSIPQPVRGPAGGGSARTRRVTWTLRVIRDPESIGIIAACGTAIHCRLSVIGADSIRENPM